MKTQVIVVVVFVMFAALNVKCQPFKKVSKEISRYEYRIGLRKIKRDRFHEIRVKLDKLGKLGFAAENDTLFLLESYSIESGIFYGLIWNNLDEVKYKYQYRDNSFDFGGYEGFPPYIRDFVQEWDTVAIRHEERMDPETISPRRDIYATRVIKHKDSLEIDRIKFAEFFLLERDRFGWRDRGR